MNTTVVNATEYRELPLAMLTPSTTNPRRKFDAEFLKGMAESIRAHGVLTPLLVRPKEEGFEIVFGEQRYRSAQMAEAATVPVRIKNMTDAQVLEAQLVENLQRRDVHPMEEAEGYKRLLTLDEPKYSIEQIAAKVGKTPIYIAQRLKLTELCEAVVEAFFRDSIGVGHALMLAKLPTDLQTQGLTACFKEVYTNHNEKPARILLPVRNLRFWIETNVLLFLKDAPFDRRNAHLVAIAGSCVDCPSRTGHNKLLFADLGKQDACTNPSCYQAKVEAHVAATVAAKPKLVQISTVQGQQREGSPVLPRNKYVAIQEDKPKDKAQAQWPQYKTCKFVTEAIVAEGHGQGTIQKVCTNADCPVHHPKQQRVQATADNAKWRAEQEKRRREEAIANTTGIRVLAAIGAAVPVRLMKRDLLFVVERLAAMLDENRLAIVARQHGIKKAKDTDSIEKSFAAFLRRAEESMLGRLAVELTVVLAAARSNAPVVLKEAAATYKVDTDAVAAKVRKEFADKEKAKAATKPAAKAPPKAAKKAKAA